MHRRIGGKGIDDKMGKRQKATAHDINYSRATNISFVNSK